MSHNFQPNYSIPENFQSVLTDFTREVLRNQPKDINEFGYKFFTNLDYEVSKKKQSLKRSNVPLSNFDTIFSNLLTLYFFDGLPDVEKLQMSLDRTIDAIPVLSSVLKTNDKTSKRQNMFFRPDTENRVKIVVKEAANERVYDFFKPNGPEKLLSVDEGSEIFKLMEPIVTQPNPFQPTFEEPVLKVTLLTFTTRKKCVMGISINHAVADLYSSIRFVNTWGDIDKGVKGEEFSFSREWLKVKDVDLKSVSKERLEKLCLYHPRVLEKEDAGLQIHMAGVHKMVVFSPERLSELKGMVEKRGKFSSHDCVSAQIWRLAATVAPPKSIVPMMVVVNVRKLMGKENYFGNGCITVSFDEMEREEILGSSFSDLVWKVRALLVDVNEKDVQAAVDLYEKHGIVLPYRKQTVLMDDWRLAYKELPEFSSLKPERVVVQPTEGPIFVPNVYFTQAEKDGGISVRVALESKVFEKFKGLDLSDPEVLQKIK